MQTGTKVSAIAHAALVGWALFGGTFKSEPLPFDVQDVSVVSAEQFAAMTAPRQAPEVAADPTESPQPPQPDEPAELPEPEEAEPVTQETEPVPQPAPDPAPEPDVVVELPDPEVSEDIETPVPPEPEEIALLPPGARPEPRPVDRVAPQPVAPPPPDVRLDEVETPPVSAEEGAEQPREQQEETAQREATDRIQPDAEDSAETAPTRSPRPPARPRPPQTAETPEPAPDRTAAVDDALAEAIGGGQEAPAPTGPPLTGGEKDALRIAVSTCWNVGSLSTDALNTTVVVAVAMQPDGRPISQSIRLMDSSGGTAAAAQQAFEAARRAIIRCGARGYDLPQDKFGQWQNIEMTFNPERMRIK